jgi:hypothetical protein
MEGVKRLHEKPDVIVLKECFEMAEQREKIVAEASPSAAPTLAVKNGGNY